MAFTLNIVFFFFPGVFFPPPPGGPPRGPGDKDVVTLCSFQVCHCVLPDLSSRHLHAKSVNVVPGCSGGTRLQRYEDCVSSWINQLGAIRRTYSRPFERCPESRCSAEGFDIATEQLALRLRSCLVSRDAQLVVTGMGTTREGSTWGVCRKAPDAISTCTPVSAVTIAKVLGIVQHTRPLRGNVTGSFEFACPLISLMELTPLPPTIVFDVYWHPGYCPTMPAFTKLAERLPRTKILQRYRCNHLSPRKNTSLKWAITKRVSNHSTKSFCRPGSIAIRGEEERLRQWFELKK